MLAQAGVPLGPDEVEATTLASQGRTPLYAAIDGQLAGILAVADTVRPEAAETVTALRRLGLRVLMLTGDRPETARAVAHAVGIDEVRARVRPDGKAAVVRELQDQGATVVMAGDGINDAPALAQADLGIAMGAGTDIAMAAGDITLVRSDLRGVLTAIRLSRRTVRTIKQNLTWAFSYNVLLIPVAAGALFPVLGVQLDPMLAAAAMALESLSVVGNSLRLAAVPRRRWLTAFDHVRAAPVAPGAGITEGGRLPYRWRCPSSTTPPHRRGFPDTTTTDRRP